MLSWQTAASVDEPLMTTADENRTAPSPRCDDHDPHNEDNNQQQPPNLVITEIAHKNNYNRKGNHPDLEQLLLI